MEATPAPVETAAQPDAPRDLRRRHSVVIWTLIVAAFVVILNETVMGVAIPHLKDDLGISAVDAQWLTTAFLLTMAVVIPITGFLLQRFHTRPVYLTAMALFTLGTLVAALAPGFEVLLAARVIQASGTAIMMPLLITTVMQLEPPATRGRRMGSITVVIAVAPAIGPTISGLILNAFSWRFMFVFVLPIAVAVLAIGWRLMENVTEPRKAPLDLLSVALSAVGFGGLVYGLSTVGEGGGGIAPETVVALTLGGLGVGAFIWRQLVLQRVDDALLDLRTFRTSTFSVAVVMFIVSMMALFGMIILLPLFMQDVLGLSVLQSGLMLLPGGLVMGLMGPIVGRAYDRIGARPLVLPGAIVTAGVLWVLAAILSPTTPWWQLVAAHSAMSVGLALLFTPLFSASLGSLPARLYSHGSATVSALQQVAGAAGTALFVSTMASIGAARVAEGVDPAAAQSAGMRGAFTIAAILATVSIGAALAVRTPDDAASAPVGH
ncbi:DHA2 family efflux MFS transporter permease subunit [Demequina lignilytica]|uniref:DHA2 family efflux MFS transporter permease subunit n=1 Tax=Demequina lignilytica TaxID=3051663 RepID=A0AB35MFA8_9MICO|nr:DHA2 family efflux MFS transporter permease subunit [Demequina sp. SYSU T0a273]MDN4482451.1 DHA2 family efflux MFS transporter permease subunit [Demequina sp. SYSU T0a273]